MALRLAYLGWDYRGLAIQEGVDTIEVSLPLPPVHPSVSIHILPCLVSLFQLLQARLFKSLQTTKLIESPSGCGYSRCGRTDAGVSALGQVGLSWQALG